MSRFECLSDTNNWETKKYKKVNKDSKEKKYFKSKNNEKQLSYSKKNSFKKEKKEENLLDSKNFPSLIESNTQNSENNENNIVINENALKNYIGIVNHEIKTDAPKKLIPDGWTLIGKKNHIYKNSNNLYQKNTNHDTNYDTNYELSIEILENRYKERDELNEILGDISPYWNMYEEYNYDTREYEKDEDSESSGSEYEYDDELY